MESNDRLWKPWKIFVLGGLIALFLLAGTALISWRLISRFKTLNREYTLQQAQAALSQLRSKEQLWINSLLYNRFSNLSRDFFNDSSTSLDPTLLFPEGTNIEDLDIHWVALVSSNGQFFTGWRVEQGQFSHWTELKDLIPQLSAALEPRNLPLIPVHFSTQAAHYYGIALEHRQPLGFNRSLTRNYLVMGQALGNSFQPVRAKYPFLLQLRDASQLISLDQVEPIALPPPDPNSLPNPFAYRPRPGPGRQQLHRDPPTPRPFSLLDLPLLSRLVSEGEWYLDPVPYQTSKSEAYTRMLSSFFLLDQEAPRQVELLVPREIASSVRGALRLIHATAWSTALLILFFTGLMVRENSKRKSAEMGLLSSIGHLRDANQRKDRLVSIIAHDLRAPLTGVINLAELMLRAPEKFEKSDLQHFASDIHQTSKNLAETLENLLSWARLTTQSQPMTLSRIPIASLLGQVLSLFRPYSQWQALKFETNFPEDLHLVTDQEMLRTILRNLLSNAVRYNKPKGSIQLSAIATEQGIEIQVANSVQTPFPSQVQEFLESSAPMDSAPLKGDGPVGFGLGIARELTRVLRGNLTVQAPPDASVIFTLCLPNLPISTTSPTPLT